VKYAFIIALVGLLVGYAVYLYLPLWVFALFVLMNFLGWAVVRGASNDANREEEEE
jgi:Flp pilus assembly protein TadB